MAIAFFAYKEVSMADKTFKGKMWKVVVWPLWPIASVLAWLGIGGVDWFLGWMLSVVK